MTLDQLESVHAIIEKGSFRAAAEYLHRSQPALSASIKNLEEEFNIQIFDRSSYRPRLTEVGAVFINASRKALEAAQYTSRVGLELGQKKTETKLRVSVDPLAPIEAIELMAEECLRPTVPVALILDKTILTASHNLLLEGKVDLALAPCAQNNAKIESIVVKTVSLVTVVSRRLLQEKKNADAEFLKKHAQVLVYDRDFDEPSDELMPNPVYEGGGPKIFAPDHFTKLRLIENGLGWGRISEDEYKNGQELAKINKRLCAEITLDICLMRAKSRPIGPIARRIWDVFSKKQL